MQEVESVRLPMRSRVVTWLIDILAGFCAFALTMVTSILAEESHDVRPILVAATVAFLLVGFWRGRRGWTPSALRVAAGGLLPAIAMLIHTSWQADRVIFTGMIVASASALLAGMIAKDLAAKAKLGLAGAIGAAVCVADVLLATVVMPTWVANSNYRFVRDPVAPIHVRTFDGQLMRSQDWKGHVVVLAFWATWCTPCIGELPELARLRARYRGDPAVTVLAVNPGWGGDDVMKAKNYLTEHHLALDGAEVIPIPDVMGAREAVRSLGVKGLPAVVVIDRAGYLRVIHSGYLTTEHLSDTLQARIDALLRNN